MAKVSVKLLGDLAAERGSVAPDEIPDDDVETRSAFPAASPLALRLHAVPAGRHVRWRDSARGHLIYIWSGSVVLGEQALETGSMVIVEHGASAELMGGSEGGEMLVFNATDASPPPSRQGRNVHVLPAQDVPRVHTLRGNADVGAAMFANARCPTCELWLHENRLRQAGMLVDPHYHTEDEIIVVTAGEIVLGRRTYGRGTAIAVASDTIYSFSAGPSGLTFINFRPGQPTYARAGSKEPVDELAFYTEIGEPRYRRVPEGAGA